MNCPLPVTSAPVRFVLRVTLALAWALGFSRPALAQVSDTTTATRAETMAVQRPLASLHVSAGTGVGSMRATTAAVRTSVSPVYWFRPNVGVGLDFELAAQSEMSFGTGYMSGSHYHSALAVALACRVPLRQPLLFTLTAGGYTGGGRAPRSSSGERTSGGGVLGLRMAYMAQLGPAEIGPVIALGTSLGMTYSPEAPVALSATLGLQGGFTVSRRDRKFLRPGWSSPSASAARAQRL